MEKALISWSTKEYHSLPWRKRRSLYGTLVSEIMLQQTTVGTVLKHFDRFLDVYPTIQDLAAASEEEVCSNWQGLGYYRRARNLRKAAIYIVEELGGEFPETVEELKVVPGIGDYTASALISIGMNEEALAVDANLERVLSRYFLIDEEKGPKLQKLIQAMWKSGKIKIPFNKFNPRDLNEALMDLGRVFCQARRADCLLCPLAKSCAVHNSKKSPLNYPQVKEAKRKKEFFELELLRVVVTRGDKVLGYIKEDTEWLSGQVEIPTFILKSDDKKLQQYPRLKKGTLPESFKSAPSLKTAITKYKITNQVLVLKNKEFQELISKNDLEKSYKYFQLDGQKHHFSTTTHKCFKKIDLEV